MKHAKQKIMKIFYFRVRVNHVSENIRVTTSKIYTNNQGKVKSHIANNGGNYFN